MNKRYMDFVPQDVARQRAEAERKAKAVKQVREVDDAAVREIFAEKKTAPKYGVIEDFSDKFVERTVEKRPLNHKVEKTPAQIEAEKQAAIAKAKKVSMSQMPVFGKKAPAVKPAGKTTEKATSAKKPVVTDEVLKAVVKKAEKDEKTMKLPQAKFVNTEKIEKRPLSKNVYQKPVVAPVEEPKGPVTIIQKPEKDSKVGLIVTIIITIILGAAAGTVAFLLLPK